MRACHILRGSSVLFVVASLFTGAVVGISCGLAPDVWLAAPWAGDATLPTLAPDAKIDTGVVWPDERTDDRDSVDPDREDDNAPGPGILPGGLRFVHPDAHSHG
jgi:hypothetical protein